jgi:two-component SAPR family response regulator
MEGTSDEPPSIKTILLVVDDSAIASRLSELLAQQTGNQVILVSDCLTTLKFLHYCKPDLILLDDRLLHSNGIELGPRLTVMKDLQDIPIFVLCTDFFEKGFVSQRPLGTTESH